MIRAILSVVSAVALAGCLGTEPSTEKIPSGTQAPRVKVEVLAGTKANPVPSPIVRVTWEHQDSVDLFIGARKFKGSGFESDSSVAYLKEKSGNGVTVNWSRRCVDSLQIYVSISSGEHFEENPSSSNVVRDSSTTVYCK